MSDEKRRPVTREESYSATAPLTIDQCREAMLWWANRLKLGHWGIDVEFCRYDEMGDNCGECKFLYSKLRATIKILDPVDSTSRFDPMDFEQVIVHELLHLTTAAWYEWTHSDSLSKMGDVDNQTCIEHPVDLLSWTLVDLRRRGDFGRAFSWESGS